MQELVSIYFDTPDLALSKRGVFLRVRESGGRYVQTIKAMQSAADLFERFEWETEISGRAPASRRRAGHGARATLDARPRAALRLLFETRMRRTLHRLTDSGSEIEVAIDQGEIVAGARATAISEVELELKEGDTAALFRLARTFAGTVPLQARRQDQGRTGLRAARRC